MIKPLVLLAGLLLVKCQEEVQEVVVEQAEVGVEVPAVEVLERLEIAGDLKYNRPAPCDSHKPRVPAIHNKPSCPRRCHKSSSASSSSSSSSSEWPTWYPTIESSSSSDHEEPCHKPHKPCHQKPKPCDKPVKPCHRKPRKPCKPVEPPKPCPPKPCKPCHKSSSSSSSSSCTSSSSSSTSSSSSSSSSNLSSSSSYHSRVNCPPRPFISEFIYEFKSRCKPALMTVLKKHGACHYAELSVKQGCHEVYNSKRHNRITKLGKGTHKMTMTMISEEQESILGTSVNPNCPHGMNGMCYDFRLFKVCFCN